VHALAEVAAQRAVRALRVVVVPPRQAVVEQQDRTVAKDGLRLYPRREGAKTDGKRMATIDLPSEGGGITGYESSRSTASWVKI